MPRIETPPKYCTLLRQLNKKCRDLLSFTVQSPFFLAPMLNVTTPVFQKLCYEQGAGLTVTPMVFLDLIVNRPQQFLDNIGIECIPRPVGIQVIGNDPALVKPASDVLSSLDFDFLDFNAACPAGRELRRGVGGALLQTPSMLERMLETLSKYVPRPLTVKTRVGFTTNPQTFAKVRKILQKSSSAVIFLHGRTVTQQYSGKVDFGSIGDIVMENPDKIVVGNGDVRYAQDARDMVYQTQCDAVMIGRRAIGNPFLFDQLVGNFLGGPVPPVTIIDAVESYERFLALTIEEDNLKRTKFAGLKAQLQWYLKYYYDTRRYRRGVGALKSIQEIREFCNQIRTDFHARY